MRSLKIAAAALASVSLLAIPTLASAEDTVATFEVTAAGGLSITVPTGDATTPLNLGSVAAGSTTFAPQLGAVTVTDTRAALVATWTAAATGTNFDLTTTGADPINDPNQRVAAAAIAYSATPVVELGESTGLTTPSFGTLATGSTIGFAGSGSNTVSWTPTLTMTLLPTQVAGVYQGTVTHSVS